ncbi:MAG: NAD(P)H-quinone oxidoreductase [Gammaproteobacteria bacterium]
MKAILLDGHGTADVMRFADTERPRPGPGQLLIEVVATSVNRPDIIQRQGHYPPPPGESAILGLEAAGRVCEHGPGAEVPAIGARVTALLPGGGYAQYAVAYAGQVIPIPDWMTFEHAACIPEAYITAFQNVFLNAGLGDGETILLHGGGGGVNTAAIQICRALAPASTIIVTASGGKLERVRELGAHHVIDYREEDFAERTRELTAGHGADVILDHIGGPYLAANLKALAVDGRLALIGTLGGRTAEIDLTRLLVKRQTIIGSVLRSRGVEEKTDIVRRFAAAVMPHFSADMLPVIDCVLPLESAAEAHSRMEQSTHFGKIVLEVDQSK